MRKKSIKILKTLIISCMLIFGFFIVLVQANDATVMSIYLTNPTVSSFETFNVGVYCMPVDFIRAYELNIEFNATLLQANEVTVGNFFDGYTIFSNNGSIDNVNGKISSIYGLILGPGNVSESGFLVNVSFSAQGISGISEINLIQTGVTNETQYLPLTVSNGSVQIDGSGPMIVDMSPNDGYTGDDFIFNISVVDNSDDPSNISAYVHWNHGDYHINDSMMFSGGNYFEKTVSLDLYSSEDLMYNFFAVDPQGNTITTDASNVSIRDNDEPSIVNIQASPSSQEKHGTVNISVTVTDNIALDDLYVNITYPDSSNVNISLLSASIENSFYYSDTYETVGIYYYFFWVIDSSGNMKTSDIYSFIISDTIAPQIINVSIVNSNPIDTNFGFGWTNISCTIIDNDINSIKLTLIYPDASVINVSMILGPFGIYYFNSTFSLYGDYSNNIWVNDTSNNQNSTSVSLLSLPPNWDINMDGTITVFDFLLISNHFNETGNQGWIREDVDNNGKIEILDFVFVSNHFNETW
jgi:hypothetical protein